MTSSKNDSGNYSRKDVVVIPPAALEGEILDNLPVDTRPAPRPQVYDFTKEITWTDDYFLTLPRHIVETIAKLYREGRGTLVANEYARTRTWLPNNVLLKPGLKEWAHTVRHAGKYRWLEINYTSAGHGLSVVTLVYHDHSGPVRRKYRWFQSVLHHSMQAGNWRNNIAKELRKMHRDALWERQQVMKSLTHDPRKLLR